MSDKVYDILKWIALYLLPAIGTLYFALAGIWNFPFGEQVVGTITAVDTFLGVVLGISNTKYKTPSTWNDTSTMTEPIAYADSTDESAAPITTSETAADSE